MDATYNGTIMSPNWPLGYGPNIECSWLIRVRFSLELRCTCIYAFSPLHCMYTYVLHPRRPSTATSSSASSATSECLVTLMFVRTTSKFATTAAWRSLGQGAYRTPTTLVFPYARSQIGAFLYILYQHLHATSASFRFCCDQLPRDVISSATNEMLVLFRTFPESRDCDDVEYPWKCVMTFVGFKVGSASCF